LATVGDALRLSVHFYISASNGRKTSGKEHSIFHFLKVLSIESYYHFDVLLGKRNMAEIEKSLKGDFPEATDAEIARFVAAYGIVETKLEDYLDWRMWYGQDQDDQKKADADRIKKGERALVSSKYICSI
jgi:hypothetical protein